MSYYIYNKNVDNNGRHEVHTTNCSYLPAAENRVSIGSHSYCKSAISYAKTLYPSKTFDGCYYCSTACNKG